jgi:hypothetical protein
MKNKKQNDQIIIKYQFTKMLTVLAYTVILLCVTGIGVSAYRIWTLGIHGVYDALKSPFLILVCILCIVIVISILIRSQYVIENKKFIIQFGIIKSSFEIKKITSILLNSDTKKLTIYFGEDFTVISIPVEENENLVRGLRDVNPNIDYSFTLTDQTDQKKEK